MKIKKLAAYTKQCGKVAWLMTTRTYEGEPLRQYVHTGKGIYPIDRMGQLDPEMLLTVFDVTGNERGDWHVSEKELEGNISKIVADNLPEDIAMQYTGLMISMDSTSLMVLRDEQMGSVVFVDRDALKPVDDVDERTFWLRTLQEGEVVVVKSGFMNVAAITLSNAQYMAEAIRLAAEKAWIQKQLYENEHAINRVD